LGGRRWRGLLGFGHFATALVAKLGGKRDRAAALRTFHLELIPALKAKLRPVLVLRLALRAFHYRPPIDIQRNSKQMKPSFCPHLLRGPGRGGGRNQKRGNKINLGSKFEGDGLLWFVKIFAFPGKSVRNCLDIMGIQVRGCADLPDKNLLRNTLNLMDSQEGICP
jgi:hypothetical protein